MDADTVEFISKLGDQPDFLELSPERRLAVIPQGWAVEDISKYLPPPARIKQKVELLNLPSLVDYTSKFKGPKTVIFADEGQATYDVVLDYHTPDGLRGDIDHVARYACPLSDSWKAWKDANGKTQTQAYFGKFIEANLVDIVRPAGADMLQMALSLQVKKSAKFESDLRLDNGQTQFGYTEEIRGTQKGGSLAIPDMFQLGLQVFIDGEAYALDARLRYQLDEGKLWMWYELVRPNDVYRTAIKAVSHSIRSQLAGVPFWIGKRT